MQGYVKLGLAGLAMMGVGAGLGTVGYVLMKRKLETEFEERLRFEVAETKAYYSRLNKTDEFKDPNELAKTYDHVPRDEDKILETRTRNRKEGKPFLISHSTYSTIDTEYEQVNLTYFEGDDVLADEMDSVINDTESLVGNDNLLHWGWGSGNHEMVYVQNDELSTVFEIARNKGSYAKDVLGFVEHSEPRGRPRKFRRDYE